LKCSIARDNGRSFEVQFKKSNRNSKEKLHEEKTRCFECGVRRVDQNGYFSFFMFLCFIKEFDHLSYQCPKNMLGTRELQKKNKKKDKRKNKEYKNTLEINQD
jgi:U11/U12 small nuclear ribonucleoprotein SNRNP31